MPTYKKLGSKRTPGLYTFEEAQLIELYNQYSDRTDKWKIIAAKLNRTHQSVRGQYVNHLDESIDKSELTYEEKCKIDDLQTNPCYNNKYYKKWSEIAKKLSENRKQGRRTELQVKNYWNSKERSQKRKSKIMNLYGGEHIGLFGYGSCYESYGGGGHIDYGSCYESYSGGYGIN
ncbi:unnamed protein product [Rhizophagus irregularis]|nr:unnamed protein product [Rhizophagus irregularis]CAB5364782.1 unnamed protein product [Rhizophagus irregularis]